MNINLEALNDISTIMQMVITIQSSLKGGVPTKRWYNTRETAEYTGHSIEAIKNKVKDGKFIRNYHFFKRDGILLFDIYKLDEWSMGIEPSNNNNENLQVVDEIISSLAA